MRSTTFILVYLLSYTFLQLELNIRINNHSSRLIFLLQNIYFIFDILIYYEYIYKVLVVLINFTFTYLRLRGLVVMVVWLNKDKPSYEMKSDNEKAQYNKLRGPTLFEDMIFTNFGHNYFLFFFR